MFDEANAALQRNRKAPMSLGNAERNRANLSEIQQMTATRAPARLGTQAPREPELRVNPVHAQQPPIFRPRPTDRVVNADGDTEDRMRRDMLARTAQPNGFAGERADVFDAEFDRITASMNNRRQKKAANDNSDEFDF